MQELTSTDFALQQEHGSWNW